MTVKVFSLFSAHLVVGVMAEKKPSDLRKREMILLEVKQEVIRKHPEATRVIDLAREYGKSPSTILKNKDKITGREVAKGATRVTKQHPPILEQQEKQRAGDTVLEAMISGKAKAVHTDLINQQLETSGSVGSSKPAGDGLRSLRQGLASTVW
ncbi:hypothetical protein JRQ81_002436 [Phrynocephalus forsythii]|uniref:HTH psq-type domain-containing protein n=1 Tax=Phrynocephalus forsythii TaxID=171643 RepID=A0A9Q1AWJ1_9SAUR|nr:hypothetical protein JRQ81_002436 [Phrynocephalus forsythii]